MSATTGVGEPPAEPRLYVYARRNWSRWHIVPVPWLEATALCGQRLLWTERREQLPAEEFESVCLRCRDHLRRGTVVEERGALWGPGEVTR